MGIVGSSPTTRLPHVVTTLDDVDAYSKVSTPDHSRPKTLGTWKRRQKRRVLVRKRRSIKRSTKTLSKMRPKKRAKKHTGVNDGYLKANTPDHSRPKTLGSWKRRQKRRVLFRKRRCIKRSMKTLSKVHPKKRGMKRTGVKNRSTKRSVAGRASNKRKRHVKKGPPKGGTRNKNQVKFAPGTKTNKLKSNKILPSPPTESEDTQQPSSQDSKENVFS